MKSVIILLLTIAILFSQVSAQVVNETSKKDISIINEQDHSFIFDPESKIIECSYADNKKSTEDDGFTFFDVAVYASCWWSPITWWEPDEGDGLKCYNVYIDFRGTPKESGIVEIKIYWLYSDKPEEFIKTESYYFGGIIKWDLGKLMGYESTEEKPIGLRVEAKTLLSEITKENNKANANLEMGVTIDGYLYEKDSSGNVKPLNDQYVSVLSHWLFYTSEYYIAPSSQKFGNISWWDDGYYFLVAPSKPGNTPCRYLIKSTSNHSETIIRRTDELYAFENTTMDDIVFTHSKEKNFSNMFPKTLEKYPILKRFFTFLRFF